MLYVVGVIGSCAIGLFMSPSLKSVLLFGNILTLAFGPLGLVFFLLGSLISFIDEWLFPDPSLKYQYIFLNKISSAIVDGVFMGVMILAIIIIVSKFINFLM